MPTRIKSGNILDGEVQEQDLADRAVGFDKIDFASGGASGDVLTTDGAGNLFFAPPVISGAGSSVTFVAANIAARDAITLQVTGDQVFVRNGATTGEWEMYVWDAAWVLISTQDSAATDAKTIAGDIDPSTISPVLLGNVSANSRVTLVSIDVSVAFDGAPVLTVGTDAVNNELAADSEMDLGVIGTYTIVTDVEYTASVDTDIKAYFAAGGATVGTARVLVTYV